MWNRSSVSMKLPSKLYAIFSKFVVYLLYLLLAKKTKRTVSLPAPTKDINILLLGETGVGKSTWVNGIANYITYDTLDEAVCQDLFCPIPTKFTHRDTNNLESFESIDVCTGWNKNENPQADQSCTQLPKTYQFSLEDIRVHLIDTPGIGDTRGVEHDKQNFDNILARVATLNELNGICILLKPNDARVTIVFEYCIKELLKNLHNDACRNIIFCFTNSRSTFYKPGDTW